MFINKFGINWLIRLVPPIVVGPVIVVIGLGLATTAIDMAMYVPGIDEQVYSSTHFLVALVTLAVTIIAAIFFRGFFGVIPILLGIVFGYIFVLIQKLVVTSGINAAWQAIVSSSS